MISSELLYIGVKVSTKKTKVIKLTNDTKVNHENAVVGNESSGNWWEKAHWGSIQVPFYCLSFFNFALFFIIHSIYQIEEKLLSNKKIEAAARS